MAQENPSGASGSHNSADTASLIAILRDMMTSQQQQMNLQQEQIAAQKQQMEIQQKQHQQQLALQQEQNKMLQEGLVTAQQATTAAIEKSIVPREQRQGTVTEFKRLNPTMFTGTEKPLEAEKWITDITNLLEAASIPAADQVKVVKIQLTDIARTWWLSEEAKLDEPISWKQFCDSFFERFFPKTAKRQMEAEFINLKQGDKTVDGYAAEFLRLSRFAPKLVEDDEDCANRFQQGLKQKIRKSIASHEFGTYAQVLTAARRVEKEIGTEEQDKTPQQQQSQKQQKRQADQINKGPVPQQQNKRQFQPNAQKPTCTHCQKIGHVERDCRLKHGLCLVCGGPGHKAATCPARMHHGPYPALPAPPLPAVPIQARAPLPPQGQAYQQAQRGNGAGQKPGQGGRAPGKAYQMEATEAEADTAGKVMIGDVLDHVISYISCPYS